MKRLLNLIPFRKRATIVPLLRLRGAIGMRGLRGGGLSAESLESAIERAFSYKKAPIVALAIDCPGGSPTQTALIAGRIRQLAKENDKKVVAFVEDVAASGGYWLALAADEIICDETSIIGSIGVISASFGFVDAINRLGIERRVHTTGARKSLLDPFKPEEDGDVEVLKDLQQDAYERFTSEVKDRRGDRLKLDTPDLFSGKVWSGKRALDIGLVDSLGHMNTVLTERYGERLQIRTVNQQKGWLQRKLRFADEVDTLFAAFEERMMRASYGL